MQQSITRLHLNGRYPNTLTTFPKTSAFKYNAEVHILWITTAIAKLKANWMETVCEIKNRFGSAFFLYRCLGRQSPLHTTT